MVRNATCFCLLSVLALPPICIAQDVYKTVDAEGRVTYSSTPPAVGTAATVEMRIDPPPTPEQRAETEARLRELEQASARRDRERREQRARRQKEVTAAEETLHETQTKLEAAKRKTSKDLQYSVTGGKASWQTNLDRADAAEKRVEEAEQDLRRARRSGGR